VPYVEKNELFFDEDEFLVMRKRNVSPSPDPLPNGMRIKNGKKRCTPYDLKIPQAAVFYINPEFFKFHNRLVLNQSLPDNIYFERLRYSLNNN
jgi:hypothetical protein